MYQTVYSIELMHVIMHKVADLVCVGDGEEKRQQKKEKGKPANICKVVLKLAKSLTIQKSIIRCNKKYCSFE